MIQSLTESLSEYYTDNLSYTNSVWLSAHNSFTSILEHWNQPQQIDTTESMFHYGVRSFMVDVHEDYILEGLWLCHGPCITTLILKSTPPSSFQSFLEEINVLLQTYTNEIITLHIESYTPVDKVKAAFDETGLTNQLCLENPNNETLTLGKMRDLNQRLVVFYNEATNDIPGIHYVFRHKENSFSLEDDKDTCVSREGGRAEFDNPNVKLFVFNHFYSTPPGDLLEFKEINDYNSIIKRIKLCDLTPNFIAVDFVSIGNNGGARKVVETLLSNSSLFYKLSSSAPKPDSTNDISYHFGSLLIGSLPSTVYLIYHRKNDYIKPFVLLNYGIISLFEISSSLSRKLFYEIPNIIKTMFVSSVLAAINHYLERKIYEERHTRVAFSV